MKKAVILWTGGKDCALALFNSIGKFAIDRLVTFVPENHTKFFAHSLVIMKAQAQSMGLPIDFVTIKEPFDLSYREAMIDIKKSNIDTIITGDISTVNDYPNWIRECASGIIDVHTPLWKKEREELLKTINPNHFKIICSLSYKKHFSQTITGKILDTDLINELLIMQAENKIDASGENGEYHSMVLSAPFFKYDIELTETEVEDHNDFFYLNIKKIEQKENPNYSIKIS
ncbi:hypothetical protein E9993_21260 [Labilibacter sediminis]|nr:hypothetical protein E9993_21260 [Labilibacter sediminis]